jgi:hypothetical protein
MRSTSVRGAGLLLFVTVSFTTPNTPACAPETSSANTLRTRLRLTTFASLICRIRAGLNVLSTCAAKSPTA